MANKTKTKLAQALRELLKKKPLSRITISELTDMCGVNRMTFYYHFNDIYELVEWGLQYELQKQTANSEVSQMARADQLIHVFNAIKNDQETILNIYHSVSLEQMEHFLFSLTIDYVRKLVNDRLGYNRIGDREKNFIIDFYNYAFIGLMIKWFKHDMDEDPGVIVTHLDTMLEGVIELSIRNLSE
ncbi:MAG: TetR/AcrR family transcriptional regulator [Erysipelotrichaceae bacterium]|nr:TetR/AcrR family transcriptional regulator [Erysipelotrichaceae bacterium]